jgi:AcrR family transcriptional regulator
MALGRVISRLGPSKLTLAVLAKEAGLAAPTLIQRYGSKQKLLVKLSKGAGDARPLAETLRTEGRTPLEIIRGLLLCYADLASTPTAFINNLSALLEIDLGDQVLRRHLIEYRKSNEDLMVSLIKEAVAAGELRCPDPRGVARVLGAVVSGSLLSWAIHRDGDARAWLARDVETLLGPYRKERR